MTPVSLRLKNFLSYGTAADVLDFETFSVACLSGGNGQGKSALLDALTWAIWGEARKSSERNKPDEDLLRVGAREMEVELVFDLEGTRYRVLRAFHRSASGKTSKPLLEFNVFDPESGGYHPLTAESVRATQAIIIARVGLDYDTFINSAFLLQGRSDEFTRKKPGERKEILGKILGLDRYEKLSARASQRYTERRAAVKTLETERDRLKAALEDEGRWQEEFAVTEQKVAERAATRETLRAEEAALAEKLATLDAAAREAEGLTDQLARLDARRTKLEAEKAEVARKIAEAEALVARAGEIQSASERYEALVKERQELDGKAGLQRGLETQLGHQKLQLAEQRMQLEAKLERASSSAQTAKERLDDAERRLVEKPRVVEALQKAEAAAATFARLRKEADQRATVTERIAQIDKLLTHERGHLKGELALLLSQVAEAERAAVPVDTLEAEQARLTESVATVHAWQQDQETVREKGTTVKERLAAVEAEGGRLKEEIAALEEKRARIRATDADACPTCGTALTPEHRETVEETYGREIAALEEKGRALAAQKAQLEEERDGLRRQFLDLRSNIERANGAATKLAQVQEQLANVARHKATLEEQRARVRSLQETVEGETFLPEKRAEQTTLNDQLAATPFDQAAFDAAQEGAARVPMLREKREELDDLAARRDTLGQQVRQHQEEAARLRADLDAGTALKPIQQRIDALAQQLAAVGYDGPRHEAVIASVESLAHAPTELVKLMEAQRALTSLSERRTALAQEGEGLGEEHRALTAKLAEVQKTLHGRDTLLAERAEKQKSLAEAEALQREAQAHLGALRERLQRCAADRAALQKVYADLREAKREAALYRHLRSAFGKHGIPSLIIEETLPEIEERANDLLGKLSNGRTRVSLETLADKKTGGTKETLDIRITDEGGVARSYETFSGGEAFRVNFALRIALAQLLAERSGVRIRTLVIDEGFGTQDQEGIQNLVEAIRTIQDDFDKILVITHLEELKGAFPIRIEVTKRPVEGSTFEVVGV